MTSRQYNDRYRSKRKRNEAEYQSFGKPYDNRQRSLDSESSRRFSNEHNPVKRSHSFDLHGDRDRTRRRNSFEGSDHVFDRENRYLSKRNDESRPESGNRDDERRYYNRDDQRRYSSRDNERRYSSRDEDRLYSIRDDERRYSTRDGERRHSGRGEERRHSSHDEERRYSTRDEERRRSSHDEDLRYSSRDNERRYSNRDEDDRYPESSESRYETSRLEHDVHKRYSSRDERGRSSQYSDVSKWFFCDTCKHLVCGRRELDDHVESSFHRLNQELEKKNKSITTWSPVYISSKTGLPMCEVCPFSYRTHHAWKYHINSNGVHRAKAARADPRLKPFIVDYLVE